MEGMTTGSTSGKPNCFIGLKWERPGVHAYHKHPVLLLPSGPDKVWALRSHGSESLNSITLSVAAEHRANPRAELPSAGSLLYYNLPFIQVVPHTLVDN